MQRVVFYDDGTDPDPEPGFQEGEIVFISDFEDTDGPIEIAARQPDYTGYVIDATPDRDVSCASHYIDTTGVPTAVARPVITQTYDFEVFDDGVDEVRFSLPAGTVTVWDFDNSETTNVSTQDFVFKTTIKGVWSFTFEPPFPYAAAIIEITSNANV